MTRYYRMPESDLYYCERCGTLVHDASAHDRWHKWWVPQTVVKAWKKYV